MHKPIASMALALCLLAPAATAQPLDPQDPETRFRALIVFGEKGKACLTATATETSAAVAMSLGMAAEAGEAATAYRGEFVKQLSASTCSTPGLVPLASLGQKLAKPVAHGYLLAFIDYASFCPASALAADARLLAIARQPEIDEADPDVAAARTSLAAFLPQACPGDWKQLGLAFDFAGAARAELTSAAGLTCWRDGYVRQKMFECVYGTDAFRNDPKPSAEAFARYQVRAALAKSAALTIDRLNGCNAFSAAEKAVGTVQMNIDASAAPEFAKQGRYVSPDRDPELRHPDAAAVLAAGAAMAAGKGCDALAPDSAGPITGDTPLAERGERVTPATGAQRIRETLDRMAMLAASLPGCNALPNFARTRAQAEAYISGWSVAKRLQVASQLSRPAQIIDENACDAARMGAQWSSSPLLALDALAGVWN